MRIGMLSPIAWRTPPRGYGPWELVASNITEGLVAKGHDVTLFATQESVTSGRLVSTACKGYEEDQSIDPNVWRPMHIAEACERADEFDIIHNHFDFTSLTYSRLISTPMVTTIHGFSSPDIYPVFEKYNDSSFYVSISDSDRYEKIDYVATVYNGLNLDDFSLVSDKEDFLLFLGRICFEKGTKECIEIASKAHRPLVIAGIIQEHDYFNEFVKPYINDSDVSFIGPVNAVQRNSLLGKASALLHPIMRPERFGLTIIESLACGTPVIAFDKGSPREIIAHGSTGFVVDSVDEAASAVESLRDIDSRSCRSLVEKKFSKEKMVEGYVNVYEKILSGL